MSLPSGRPRGGGHGLRPAGPARRGPAPTPTSPLEDDPRAALRGAELVLLLTEWDQFVALDPADAADGVAERVIIDGRNALDPVAWREAGWTYAGVGR